MRTSVPIDISCTARRGPTLSGPFCIQGQTYSDYVVDGRGVRASRVLLGEP